MTAVLHWILNAGLLAASVACFVAAFYVSGAGNVAGCVVTGVALLAAAIVFTVYTVKNG